MYFACLVLQVDDPPCIVVGPYVDGPSYDPPCIVVVPGTPCTRQSSQLY